MNILFIGTVEFSRRCLLALVTAGNPPQSVITMPKGPGRQRHSDWADLSGISPKSELWYPQAYDDILWKDIREMRFDLILVCGWSRLLPTDLAPVMVGSHPTLLPRGRGRHPIPWSIILSNGQWAGLTFFRLTEAPDAGPILWQEAIHVLRLDHAAEVYEKVCQTGERGILQAVRAVENGYLGIPQSEQTASWWPKRMEAENRINWTGAETVARLVRAVSRPYPGAWSLLAHEADVCIRWWRVMDWCDHGLIAPPGTVQEVSPGLLVVATGDGCVAFSEWEVSNEQVPIKSGMRLT